MGTIKLYEAKNRLFSSINRTLGEGIAQLLSAQILAGQYERQKAMLTQSEIKLLHAQVNPHFLFNALNTIKAVIRRDSEQASQLVQYLSTFFRKNLKRPSEFVKGALPVAVAGQHCYSARIIPAAIARVYPATDSGKRH